MTSAVGFSAYPSTTTGYDVGAIVQFDTVVTNIGGFYSGDLGVFICPIDGIYLFPISLYTDNAREMGAKIVRDGSKIHISWSDGVDNIQSAVVAVTECLATQTVWVECTGDGKELIGRRNGHYFYCINSNPF